MRLRIAVPILTTSASIMLAGLAIGHAQEQQQQPGQPEVHVRPPNSRPPIQLRPAGPHRPGQRVNAPPEASDDSGDAAGTESAAGTGVTPFETGIDYEATSPRALVTFNLEDADLPDLVRLISNITGKRFILPGKARSIKATVYAPTKVRVSEAYNAFLSILEVNGMTLVPAGRYLKIVESTNIENQPISTYTGESPTAATDRYITRLHHIQNVSAEDVATLLTRFKSAQGNVTAYAPTNTLIITDTGTQIRRMLRLVEVVDIPRTGEQIWVEPVHYATASDLAARLAEIFPSSDGSGGAGATTPGRPRPARATRGNTNAAAAGPTTVGSAGGGAHVTSILADERTNSLIIVATEGAYLRILEMIRQLDVPVDGEGSVHVYYVQHGDSAEIASTLQSLLGGGGSSGHTGTPGARPQAARPTTQAASAIAAGTLFEGEIRVTAHEPSNALVITSSLHDFAALRSVLLELDAPRRQVFIEAVIMELSVSRSNQLGFSYHGGVGDFPHAGALTVLGFNAQGSLSPINQDSLTGLALGVRGQNIPNSQQLSGLGLSIPAFGVVINAMATSGDANILSTPHLIAMDNVEAEISVGENVPLQTSGIPSGLSSLAGLAGAAGVGGAQGAAGLAGLAGLAGGVGSVPRQDIGTTIRLTPHINDADEVRLELAEEISSRGATEGTLGVVSINRRTAKTQVVTHDQQTVVVGGLMRDSTTTSETKVPILGDIPLLGVLFRRTERSTQKTNLLLFLTPYIIRSSADLRAIFERKMRERQDFLDRYFVFRGDEYAPAVDYSRTRGLVAEINNELDELAHEHALFEAARGLPPPEHHARAPVGAATPRGGSDDGDGDGDVVISPDSAQPGDIPASPGPETTSNQSVGIQTVDLQVEE